MVSLSSVLSAVIDTILIVSPYAGAEDLQMFSEEDPSYSEDWFYSPLVRQCVELQITWSELLKYLSWSWAHQRNEYVCRTMLAGRAFQGVGSGVILNLVEIVLADVVSLSDGTVRYLLVLS